MKRRILSCCMAFILLITAHFPPFAAAYSAFESEAPRIRFESGRGTQTEPYLISTAEELFRLAEFINSGGSAVGVFFRLSCDIDLKNEPWTPIGTDGAHPFAGSFDGAGHTVRGLYIDTEGDFAGLFGYSIGAIASVIIADSSIRGASSVGAVAGFGSVEDCVNHASVSGKTRVGGLVGEGAVYGCENHGEVSGESEVGGLVGRGEAHGSANHASVSGESFIGGCAGLGNQFECENSGSVHEASPAPEKATHSVAKFIRWALTHVDPSSIPTNANLFLPAASCGTSPWEYLFGSVRVPTSQSTLNSFFNNNYTKSMRRFQYDDITADWSRSTYATDCQGLLDAWMTYEEGESTDINVQMNYQSWCTGKGSFSEITRPFVIGEAVFMYTRRTNRMSHIGFICGFDEDGKALAVEARGVSFGVVVTRVEDRGWTHRGLMTAKFNYDASMNAADNAPLESALTEAEKLPVQQNRSEPSTERQIWDGSVASGFAGGSGTAQDPYLVTNGSELMYLSRAVKNGNTFYGKHIRMTADIRLNPSSDWQDWDSLNGPDNAFEPIGSYVNAGSYKPFRGSFDGGGHTVYGLYYSPSSAFRGIFGYVGPNPTGCIKNLNLAESYLNVGNNSGGIIGYLEDYGSVLNCRNGATVSGGLWSGGIVGYVKNTSASTLIDGCVNTGKVYGTSDTGGIVGFADTNCTVTNCTGAGLSKSYERTGGIIGTAKSSTVENCRNNGIVRGTRVIGGVAGELRDSTVNKCYNAYSISTKNLTGGLVGISKQSSIINCFNTGNISLIEDAGGIVGLAGGGRLENCYSVGAVSARRSAGAALGRYAGMPSISRVYVLKNCCAGGNGIGIQQEGYEFASESGYSGFDLASVWTLDGETQYPFAELRPLPYTSNNIPEYAPHIPPETPTPEPTSPPTPEPSSPPTPEPSSPPAPGPIWGDVDGSGSVNVADAITLLRYALGLLSTDDASNILLLGDSDGNGLITLVDAISLLRIVLGLRG